MSKSDMNGRAGSPKEEDSPPGEQVQCYDLGSTVADMVDVQLSENRESCMVDRTRQADVAVVSCPTESLQSAQLTIRRMSMHWMMLLAQLVLISP